MNRRIETVAGRLDPGTSVSVSCFEANAAIIRIDIQVAVGRDGYQPWLWTIIFLRGDCGYVVGAHRSGGSF
jgi:hypothetical protein